MAFKPMKRRDFERLIRTQGWQLVKAGSGDWKIIDSNGNVIKPFIKVTHPGGEVIAPHVREIHMLIQLKGEQ